MVFGVGVGAGGGIGSGAGADEDVEAAVLGPRHGAGGSRPTGRRLSLSQSSALLRGARACVSGVWGGTGRQSMAALPLLLLLCAFDCSCGGLACSLAAGACAPLHGVFIFLDGWRPPSSGPPLLFPLLPCAFLYLD